MRQDEDLRMLIQCIADGGERRADARVARHLAVLHGHVQVFPDEDPLVAQVRVRHPQDFHDAFDQATTVSIIRFEKPHSLSYHEQAFTRVPSMTFFRVASKIDECSSLLKSTDTSGSLVYARKPMR